jgi:hypothetical protein
MVVVLLPRSLCAVQKKAESILPGKEGFRRFIKREGRDNGLDHSPIVNKRTCGIECDPVFPGMALDPSQYRVPTMEPQDAGR